MAEPKIEKKSDRADPTLAAVATKRTSKTWDTNGVTPPADIPAPDALTREATHPKPPNYLDDALKHAELPDPAPDPFADIRGNSDEIHKKFQLPKGLPNLAEAASERTTVYQDVRYFAQNVLDEVSFYYGATTACVLPVLYAPLGTCAYLLRSMKMHIRNQTYIPHYANSARFIIAAIGGAVVGLFDNFTVTQGATISPLAIAFLVGYAVDVFYAFLDGLLQTFIKNTPAPAPATSREKTPVHPSLV